MTGFDRADGQDVLDLSQLKRAAAGCAAVVHLAALAHDTAGTPEQIMAINVLGTWHTLLAAETTGMTVPSVPVRAPERYQAEPWRALVDCSAASAVLGWRPRYRWSDRC